MLDTGQHQIIHGNVEFDRLTLRAYDYMNFFPFYTRHPLLRVDMPGVEVLDEAGVPLLIDRFPPDARFKACNCTSEDTAGERSSILWRTCCSRVPHANCSMNGRAGSNSLAASMNR
jgi:hypothetical protein